MPDTMSLLVVLALLCVLFGQLAVIRTFRKPKESAGWGIVSKAPVKKNKVIARTEEAEADIEENRRA